MNWLLEKYGRGGTSCVTAIGIRIRWQSDHPMEAKVCRTWLLRSNSIDIFLCRNSQLYMPIGFDRHAPHTTYITWMDRISAKPCVLDLVDRPCIPRDHNSLLAVELIEVGSDLKICKRSRKSGRG